MFGAVTHSRPDFFKQFKNNIMKTHSTSLILIAVLFTAISITAFIGGFYGAVWHFYVSFLSGTLAFMLFTTKDKKQAL